MAAHVRPVTASPWPWLRGSVVVLETRPRDADVTGDLYQPVRVEALDLVDFDRNVLRENPCQSEVRL